jgi:hypothetical protein
MSLAKLVTIERWADRVVAALTLLLGLAVAAGTVLVGA